MRYDVSECGKRMRSLRENHGLTQAQVAEYLELTCSMYGKMERGQRGATIEVLVKLTELYHASLDYLMLGRKPDLDLVRDQVEELLEQVLQLQKML